MHISVRNLGLRFQQGVEILQNVSFDVQGGEFVALVGPSGCGKSTALNVLASLIGRDEAEISGDIEIEGVNIRDRVQRSQNMGYVFQRDTLLPWRTVIQNVEAGLEIRGWKKVDRRDRAQELINLVGLTGFEDYFPHQISGGMKQRTALIRTLAYDPQIILMDEPFGALDAQTRMNLQAELIRIWFAQRKTILFVTHDLSEAATLAERIVLFSKRPGTIKNICSVPFPHPRDPFELHGSKEFAEFQASLWRTESDEYRA